MIRLKYNVQSLVLMIFSLNFLFLYGYTGLLILDIIELSNKLGASIPYLYIQHSTFYTVVGAFALLIIANFILKRMLSHKVAIINVLLLVIWIIAFLAGVIGV